MEGICFDSQGAQQVEVPTIVCLLTRHQTKIIHYKQLSFTSQPSVNNKKKLMLGFHICAYKKKQKTKKNQQTNKPKKQPKTFISRKER